MTNPLEKIVDFKTLKLNIENLSARQREFAHLIDPRFFTDDANPFRAGKSAAAGDYKYETPVELEKDLFYLHPLMDPAVLEQGAVRRFPSGVNERYISEKYFEDKWVSEGNNELANRVEKLLRENLARFKEQEKIRLVDIGPCGGAITTLFALRAFNRCGLLNKVEVIMLDIVPNVLEATLLGKYTVPNELIEEYELTYAGHDGAAYKKLLRQGIMIGVKEWYANPANPKSPYTDEAIQFSDANEQHPELVRVKYYRGDGETLPPEIVGRCDVVFSAYTHHHMNLYGRRALCQQMEEIGTPGAFIGVSDFYVPSYEAYMEWYKPHFEKYKDAPPVECPLVSGPELAQWYEHTTSITIREDLRRTFVLSGVKLAI